MKKRTFIYGLAIALLLGCLPLMGMSCGGGGGGGSDGDITITITQPPQTTTESK